MEDGDLLRQKQQFYIRLDEALAESDEEPDVGRQASVRALQKAREAMVAAKVHVVHKAPCSGSHSNVIPAFNTPSCRSPERSLQRRVSSGRGSYPSSLSRAPTFSDLPSKGKGKATASTSAAPSTVSSNEASPSVIPAATSGKRKRRNFARQVPDNQQIFKGLHFYFFPNDDKNPARKMRITKAIEFGAQWEKRLNENVTHVVVDKLMQYATVLKYLKVSSFPAHIKVVSEIYPAECISYRAVLNAGQPQFRVKGYVTPELPDDPATAAPTSSASPNSPLGLNLPHKTVIACELATHECADESSSPEPPSSAVLLLRDPELVEDFNRQSPVYASRPADAQGAITEKFEAAIQRARELQYVPLERDEEVNRRPVSYEGTSTDDELATDPAAMSINQPKSKCQVIQGQFQCMYKHTGDHPDNPNAATITILQQMADYYGLTGDEWRTRAYRKAISTLRNHPTKVWTKIEALALPQIGERLATKIEEIAVTNHLRRLDNAMVEPADILLKTFMKVYGAGFAKASEWVSQGYKTLDEVLEKAVLSDNQRIGIEHYEDFNTRIPRAEVAQHADVVRKALHKIDPAFEVIIGGSYRRGSRDSGDIDCIVTHAHTGHAHLRAVVIDRLVPRLIESGFLVASLATTSRDDGSRWHGASCLPGSTIWRRVDLLLVPSSELGAALIYFTGDDIFNRSLRLLASTKGMRLNQRGLYKNVIRGKGRVKLSQGDLVEAKDEKRIFEILGVPWRPPEHRIC